MRLAWLRVVGPGILIAATGVGAGDLLTASLGGSAVGLALLWAAAAGAVLKWILNEGIARWQMATALMIRPDWVAVGRGLAVGYVMTALFGIAMLLIGSRVVIRKGPTVAIDLAGQLAAALGPFGFSP